MHSIQSRILLLHTRSNLYLRFYVFIEYLQIRQLRESRLRKRLRAHVINDFIITFRIEKCRKEYLKFDEVINL